MPDKSPVSIEQHQCMVCGTVFDTGVVLLDTRLRKSMERHTVTGRSLCPEHQKLYDDGYIAMVGVKDKPGPNGPERTGLIVHLAEHAFTEVIVGYSSRRKDGTLLPMCWVPDEEVINKLAEMATHENV